MNNAFKNRKPINEIYANNKHVIINPELTMHRFKIISEDSKNTEGRF